MGTVTLGTGAVTLTTTGTGGPHPSSGVVGSPPQWNDGSDATYATIYRNVSTAQDNAMRAPLDLLSEPGVITSVDLSVRASSATSGSWAFLTAIVPAGWVEGTGGTVSPIPDLTTVGGAGIQTSEHDFNWTLGEGFESDAATLDSLLRSGAYLWFGFSQAFNHDLTVYDVTLTVTTVLADTDQPVTRLFPRDDALGLGSAPRLFPTPRGVRVVGGQN